jgi:hypothetical protein
LLIDERISGREELQRQVLSGPHPSDVLPVVSRIGCRASKRPKPEAFRIDLCESGNAADQLNRITMKPCFAIHQVLDGIVCAIAGEWFWANHHKALFETVERSQREGPWPAAHRLGRI